MDLSIIIINYNTYKLTVTCIQSVIKFTYGLDYEILLIENGTHEFSSDDVDLFDKKITVIVSDTNLGFAGGNNLGLKYAAGEFILLLNSDVYLTSNAISPIYSYLKSNPGIGAISPKLIFPDGKIQNIAQRFPSIKYKIIELLRLQKFISRKKAGQLLLGAFFDGSDTLNVDWIWGAFFMFPKKLLTQMPMKKLDDTYFMYCEDMQWCWDIKKIGYSICFFSDVEAIHLMGGSSGKKNDLILKNHNHFMIRNYGRFYSFIVSYIDKLLH